LDFERFERELHELFDDFPASGHPRGQRFDRVLEDIPGLARENNLALLNLAASMVEPGESYVEIGTHHGTSLIAAMVGNEEVDFVAVDNFSFSDGSREQLDANLTRFGMEQPTILEGDAFELIPGGALGQRRVAVYYYDNGHEYEQQLDGLRMVEPWLADRALLIVDDTDWVRVERATRAYLEGQPRARLLVWIPGKDKGYPAWWEGVQVLAWETDATPVVEPAEAVAALKVPA
jgi:predicted O-methyltransferase YrrM